MWTACERGPGLSSLETDQNQIIGLSLNQDTLFFGPNATPDSTISVEVDIILQSAVALESNPVIELRETGNDSSWELSYNLSFDQAIPGYEGEFIFQANTRNSALLDVLAGKDPESDPLGDVVFKKLTLLSNAGTAPEIVNVAFPDTVQKPQSGAVPVPFTAEVQDEDGLNNISSVTLTLFTLDGEQLGDPLQMFDDGEAASGDLNAGDGIFTRTLQVENTNTARTLQVEFNAVDRAGFSAAPIRRNFTIIE